MSSQWHTAQVGIGPAWPHDAAAQAQFAAQETQRGSTVKRDASTAWPRDAAALAQFAVQQ